MDSSSGPHILRAGFIRRAASRLGLVDEPSESVPFEIMPDPPIKEENLADLNSKNMLPQRLRSSQEQPLAAGGRSPSLASDRSIINAHDFASSSSGVLPAAASSSSSSAPRVAASVSGHYADSLAPNPKDKRHLDFGTASRTMDSDRWENVPHHVELPHSKPVAGSGAPDNVTGEQIPGKELQFELQKESRFFKPIQQTYAKWWPAFEKKHGEKLQSFDSYGTEAFPPDGRYYGLAPFEFLPTETGRVKRSAFDLADWLSGLLKRVDMQDVLKDVDVYDQEKQTKFEELLRYFKVFSPDEIKKRGNKKGGFWLPTVNTVNVLPSVEEPAFEVYLYLARLYHDNKVTKDIGDAEVIKILWKIIKEYEYIRDDELRPIPGFFRSAKPDRIRIPVIPPVRSGSQVAEASIAALADSLPVDLDFVAEHDPLQERVDHAEKLAHTVLSLSRITKTGLRHQIIIENLLGKLQNEIDAKQSLEATLGTEFFAKAALETELANLRSELSAARAASSSSASDNAEVARLQGELQAAHAYGEARQTRVQELETSLATSTEQYSQLLGKNQTHRGQIQALHQQLQDLKSNAPPSDLGEKYADLVVQFRKANLDLHDATARVKELEREQHSGLDGLDGQVMQLTMQIADLQAVQTNLERASDAKSQQIEQQQYRIRELETKASDSSAIGNSQLNEHIADLTKQLNQKEKKMETLEIDRQKDDSTIVNLTGEVGDLQRSRAHDQAKIDELEVRLKVAESRRDDLAALRDGHATKIRELNTELQAAKEQSTKLAGDKSAIEKVYNELLQKSVSGSDLESTFEKERQRAQDQINRLESDIQVYAEKNAEFAAEFEHAQTVIAELNERDEQWRGIRDGLLGNVNYQFDEYAKSQEIIARQKKELKQFSSVSRDETTYVQVRRVNPAPRGAGSYSMTALRDALRETSSSDDQDSE